MANQTNSLAHTKWVCKYHIVFCPKYRRKIIYHQYREDLRDIIRTLCKYKGVETLEGHMMPDHVHLQSGPFRIDSLPAFDDAMVIDCRPSHHFAYTQVFLPHCLYCRRLEFRCISFVGYPSWHNKFPHLLASISHCLTDGGHFMMLSAVFVNVMNAPGEKYR